MTTDRLIPPPSTLPPGSTVWTYLRDSGGPTQDRSVQQQRDLIIEYCAQHGLILLLPPFEDIHKTGGTTKGRNDFDYMMSLSAVKDQRPIGLLLWNFARFSRGGPYDSQLYKSVLRHRGIVIHSLTDQIPEGEFGPVIETIIDIANKQKKDEAAMGAWRGLRHNVKQGAVTGVAPLGIKRIPITITSMLGIERQVHRWDPDPAYRTRIRKAFQMRAAGRSLTKIHEAMHLFSSIGSYVTFFKNAIYIGVLHYGDITIDDYCAPTVPRKVWDEVQALMESFAQHKHLQSLKHHPRRQSGSYILSGLAKCARCGSPLSGLTSPQPYGKDYRRYACARAKRTKECAAKPIPGELLEKSVLDKLHEFFEDPDNLINIMKAFRNDHATRNDRVEEERTSLSAQLASVRKRLTNLTNAIADTGHTSAMVKKLASLEAEEKDLQGQLAQLKSQAVAPIVVPTREMALARAHKVQDALKSKDRAFIRQTLVGIVSEIPVDRNGKSVIGRIIFYHTAQEPSDRSPPPEEDPLLNTVSLFHYPVGAPIYRHSVTFEAIVPSNGRPRKKGQ